MAVNNPYLPQGEPEPSSSRMRIEVVGLSEDTVEIVLTHCDGDLAVSRSKWVVLRLGSQLDLFFANSESEDKE